MQNAASNAWVTLLRNHDRTIAVGTPLDNSEARWAGKTARITSHHERLGVNSNPASRIELGIQSVETEPGWRANSNPTIAVR
jgi:hypothetical protein